MDKKNSSTEIEINSKKLQIIAWLENLRWNDQKRAINNFEISFYCDYDLFNIEIKEDGSIKNLTEEKAEAILLTHYLVYICDRQMDYRDIFKKGGYTISYLVKDFLTNRHEIIESKKIREKLREFIGEHIEVKKNKTDNADSKPGKLSYYFKAELPKKNDERLNNIRSYFNSEVATFSSRFMPSDILCIYKTLVYICEKFGGSFTTFLRYAIGKMADKPSVYIEENKKRNTLYSLAYSFYRLTYQLTPPVKGNQNIKNILANEKLGVIGNITENRDYLYQEKHTPKNIEEEDKRWYINGQIINSKYSFEKQKHSSKRLWCVARDFIYHPIFKECFKTIIGKEDYFGYCENDVESLELPGDVWNNNPTFAKCFWLGDKNFDNAKTPKNLSKSSKFVRTIYQESEDWKVFNEKAVKDKKLLECYPKDFDITFSFVPNMCSADKCANCPINNDAKFSNLNKFCHGQNGKLCTFVLYATGIEHECTGFESCKLREIMETD